LLEFGALIITSFSSKDAFTFNFYDSAEETVDNSSDIKSQILEKLLDCHRLALTAFYPANEFTGKNMLEIEDLTYEG